LETIASPELDTLCKVVPDRETKARLIFILEDFSAKLTASCTLLATREEFMT